MAKDRARPFSRKHRRYWIPITGGMILIGTINVTLGYCSYEAPSGSREQIRLPLRDAGTPADAAPAQPAPARPAPARPAPAEDPGDADRSEGGGGSDVQSRP